MRGALEAGRILAALAGMVVSACGPATPHRSSAADHPATTTHGASSNRTVAVAPTPPPAASSVTVRVIAIDIEHQPDGARYPSYVKESYTLESDASLDYSAYFGGMPTSMNHMDGLAWDAGERGRAVLAAATEIVSDADRRARLSEVPDEAPAPPCPGRCYRIGVRTNDADSTLLLGQDGSADFGLVDGAFTALLRAFEHATGRPLRSDQLPQR